jgi:2-iminobutanoate/2-iminopropanoate deaminase
MRTATDSLYREYLRDAHIFFKVPFNFLLHSARVEHFAVWQHQLGRKTAHDPNLIWNLLLSPAANNHLVLDVCTVNRLFESYTTECIVNMRFTHLNQLSPQEVTLYLFEGLTVNKTKMAINKDAKSLGMSWEKQYGYSQAVKVDNTIYVSGQVSHDDKGNIVGLGDMEVQMRQAYANIEKVLAQYGAGIDNVVEEVLFVTDMDAAFAARVKCRQEVFSGNPVLASTIVQIQRLAFSELMIEIKCTCKV